MSRRQLAALSLAALVLASAARAGTETPETPAPAGQWSMIPLTAFQPARGNIGYALAADGSSAYHTRTAGDGGFLAPFALPANSRVHEICAFAYDDTPANELSLIVAYTELGDADRPAITGGRVDTYVTTGLGETPGYQRLCSTPIPELVLRTYGDVNGDGVPGWLTWSIQVEPVATGWWPQIGWGGAAVRWSPPATAAPQTPPAGESAR
jgi:hypothetical protein